jgi:hypothetical protein
MIHLIDTLLNYNCKLTMYDFQQRPVVFCLAVYIDNPKDIWHVANLCRDQEFDLGSPQYDDQVKCIYFPRMILDAKSYDYLTATA